MNYNHFCPQCERLWIHEGCTNNGVVMDEQSLCNDCCGGIIIWLGPEYADEFETAVYMARRDAGK